MNRSSLIDLSPEETLFASPYAPWGMKSGQRSWYHENLQGRSQLLITAGDSWTWGDSLNPNQSRDKLYREYHGHRQKHIYGTLLAEKLQTDHINLARSDAGNLDILAYLKRVLPSVLQKYSRTFVVVTLTENHREQLSLDKGSLSDDLPQLMCDLEHRMMTQFMDLLSMSNNICAVMARNFTHSFESNQAKFASIHADRTWVDLLAEQQDIGAYPGPLRVLTMASYANIENAMYDSQTNLLDILNNDLKVLWMQTLEATSWLDRSQLNYNIATRHPTEEAHAIWADYLYRLITAKYFL